MNTAKRIGRQLADLRKKEGLTQREAAYIIGIDNGYLARLEQGKNDPSLGMADRIAAAYGARIGIVTT